MIGYNCSTKEFKIIVKKCSSDSDWPYVGVFLCIKQRRSSSFKSFIFERQIC